MAKKPSKPVSHQVRERADYRCEYCQASEWLTGQQHEIDHVHPKALGGHTALDNLSLACSACNGHKHDETEAIDPVTNEFTPLYNPRTQIWPDHLAAEARRSFSGALRIAYRAGTITGMLTDGLGLFGGTIIFIFLGKAAPDALLGFGFGGTFNLGYGQATSTQNINWFIRTRMALCQPKSRKTPPPPP